MKILVLDVCYPSADNLYGDVFVHSRVKAYLARGLEVKVVSYFTEKKGWTFEGVKVDTVANLDELRALHREFAPDVVFDHIYTPDLYPFFEEIKTPIVVWVHGIEALGFYRRLYDWKLARLPWNVYGALHHMKRIAGFHKLARLADRRDDLHFVFVSEWMRRVSAFDTRARFPNRHIIPNPIDGQLFAHHPKSEADRHRILLLRPFHSKKYANDDALAALVSLRREPWFGDLTIEIRGTGADFERLTRPLRDASNVTLAPGGFVANAEIPAIHRRFGVFLCPTRQDAQGVSMCEAMASGLVPITSNNTAIPEFVRHRHSGFLTEGAAEVASAIAELHRDPALFLRMSANAAREIRESCEAAKVCEREVAIAEALTR